MKRLGLIVCVWVVSVVSALAGGERLNGRDETVAYVRKLQTPAGGFKANADAGQKASLRSTSAAVRALQYLGADIPEKEACAKFVADCYDVASGGFADVPKGKPDIFTTAVGLMAITELKMPAGKYADGAIKYLSDKADSFEDIRIAAAGLEAIKRTSAKNDKWRGDVLVSMNQDYTFGRTGPGQARTTGGSVVTLLRLGGVVTERGKEACLKVLKEGQRQNGGWGKDDSPIASDLETTYRVMRCFMMLKANPDDVEGVRSFVAKCRNADGGYGVAPGLPSAVNGTYYAATITHWLKKNP